MWVQRGGNLSYHISFFVPLAIGRGTTDNPDQGRIQDFGRVGGGGGSG